jgi:hypothetical protein
MPDIAQQVALPSKEQIDIERLEIDREKISLEKRKFQAELDRIAREENMFFRTKASQLTFAIYVVGVLTAGVQLFIQFQKEKEAKDTAKEQSVYQQTLQTSRHQQDLSLQFAKVMAEHQDKMFSKDEAKRSQFIELVKTAFPEETYAKHFVYVAKKTLDEGTKTQYTNAIPVADEKATEKDRINPIDKTKLKALSVSEGKASTPVPTGDELKGDVKAYEISTNKYKFVLQIVASETVKQSIAEVVYKFDHASFKKTYRSSDQSSNFAQSYVGWGATELQAVVSFNNGRKSEVIVINMIQLLGW